MNGIQLSKNVPAKYSKKVVIPAPINGLVLNNSDITDVLYLNGVWGAGIALRFSGHILFAPVDCLIVNAPETGYGVELKTAHGLKLRISLGSGAENLMGEKCEWLCRRKDKIIAGTPIMKIQPGWLKQMQINNIATISVMNSKLTKGVCKAHGKRLLAMEDEMFSVYI